MITHIRSLIRLIDLTSVILLARFTIVFIQLFVKRCPPKEMAIVAIRNKVSNGIEDRVKVYFDLLSKADTKFAFFEIEIKKTIPSIFYLLRVLHLHLRYKIQIILIDYQYLTRFPNISLVALLQRISSFLCVWFETFDENSIEARIVPTLTVITRHVVADDPTLRILKYAKVSKSGAEFIFFPFPVFPKKMFYNFDEFERSETICFFGVIDSSIGHQERSGYLEALRVNGFEICGFQSGPNSKKYRPPYLQMLNVLRSSKIGLNFSNHGGIGAVTNRVLETIASGAVLFSTNEKILTEILTPQEDYIVFESAEDLITKVHSISNDIDLLTRMSSSASKKLSSKYSAECFVNLITDSN